MMEPRVQACDVVPTASSSFGVAVIGLGPQGWHVLEQLTLCEDLHLAGVWDGDATLRRTAAEQGWSSPHRLDALLENAATQGVVIALPPLQRSELVPQCLALGKHVLVEPPLAVSAEAARQWHHLARQGGCCLWAASSRRWDDDVLAAAAAVRSGRLGTLHAIRLSSAEWAPWVRAAAAPSDEHGCSLEVLAPHVVDQLAQLTTASVAHAWLQPLTAEDGFLAVLTLADGAIVQLDVRRRSLAGVPTGWLLEGDRAGYRGRRTYTPTPEGEIIDEPVRCEPMPADARLREWLRRCQSYPVDPIESHRDEWVAGICEQLRKACGAAT